MSSVTLPSGREESWRFTPLRRIERISSGADSLPSAAAPQFSGPDAFEFVMVDDEGVRGAAHDADFASILARQFATQAALVRVPTDAAATDPAWLTFDSASGAGETVVVAEPGSRATIVLDHVGSGYRTDNVFVRVGAEAELTVVSLQDWTSDALHLSTQFLELDRDARVRHVVITLGGDLVRIAPRVHYSGPGGAAELIGVFFADAGQHQEHRLYVDHSAPHCSSEVVYKGALRGEGTHTVWVGDVMIRKEALGTRTFETNRNLVLGRGARADSVPNLEIETGDVVGAGHASATGRFDDEQLFYLQSRGIPASEARRLVVRGFFADVLARLGLPELEERVLARVDGSLEVAS